MTVLATAKALFFDQLGLSEPIAEKALAQALSGCDDGELFLEYQCSENLLLDDQRIKQAGHSSSHGFGLRVVAGESTGFAHASTFDEDAFERASQSVSTVRHGYSGVYSDPPAISQAHLYESIDPTRAISFADKTLLLSQIDSYARAKEPRIRQVCASISTYWQAVYILRADGYHAADIRPLVRLSISVDVEKSGRIESGQAGAGGRADPMRWCHSQSWQGLADEALDRASTNLESIPSPAGEMTVVLGSGWPGILLHEAVGHGLEGDFNRKNVSAFSGRIGERVASPGVTVVDDGTLAERRGSLAIDDEGTPSGRTLLIEDGLLKGYLQDRLNARLMGVHPTGNGRRQSHAHAPMPRMTNTFMLAGQDDPQDMIKRAHNGLYAVHFGGGQVDITSGKFVFSCTEAYKIENGQLGAPVKGATLIGHGPEVLTRVRAIGHDQALDSGVGTCGKDGQWVPVGVGQPSLLIEAITVGGTSL